MKNKITKYLEKLENVCEIVSGEEQQNSKTGLNCLAKKVGGYLVALLLKLIEKI